MSAGKVCTCWRLRPDGSHGRGCDLHVATVKPEPEWDYGHAYAVTDGWERGPRFGEGRYVRPVTKAVFDAHKPDGHRADGSPYWNYIAVRKAKDSAWEPAPSKKGQDQ